MATPAAILSILVRTQGVNAAARDLRSVDTAGRKAHKSLSLIGTAAKSAGVLLGAAGFAKALGTMNSEYRESQKVGAQTNAVLKSTGGAAKVTRKHIEDLAGAISKKSGIDDEAIQSSENMLLTFTKVRNEAGKGNKIFDQATQVVTDMSVALGQSGKNSAIQLGKALNDPIKGITALRRVGVSFTEQQQEQIKSLVKHGDTLKAQKIILGELTTEFGGSAAAQATAADKMKVALGNLAESAGRVLVPELDKIISKITPFIQGMSDGTGAGGRFVQVLGNLASAVGHVVGWISRLVDGFKQGNAGAVILITTVASLTAAFVAYKTVTGAVALATKAMAAAQLALNIIMEANPIVLAVTALAALAVGLVIAYKKIKPFHDAVNALWGAIKTGAAAAFNWLKDHWVLLLGILTGPFGPAVVQIVKHFDQIKTAAGKIPGQVANALRNAPQTILNAGISLGNKIVTGVINGLGQLGHEIYQRFKEAAGWVKGKIGGLFSGFGKIIGIGSGDGIGKGLAGSVPPSGGAFGGSLMGAQSALRPFAAVGSRFGLRVSSGRRPGAITTSGNVSYHSSGEAIDMAGTPAGMLATFRYLKSHFGGRLAELIYGPGRVGVKDGRPYNFGSALNAQHMDHVHVAFDTGRPGVGDGFGRVAKFRGMGDGIGQAVAAAKAAGFRGQALVDAVAIAGAESGFGASKKNLKYPDHSIGMWQINQLAHHGRYGSDRALMDPFTNARAAWAISGHGKSFAPWSTWPGKASGWLARARAAVGGKSKSVKHGSSTGFGNVRQPTAGSPSEDIQAFLHPRPLKGGGPSKGFLEGQRPPAAEDTGDPNQALIDALAAAAEAERQHTEALNAVKDEIKRSNDITDKVLTVQSGVMDGFFREYVNRVMGSSLGLNLSGLRSPAGSVSRA